jgi:hypothetical protein
MFLKRLALLALLAASMFAVPVNTVSADPWPPECGIYEIC